MKWFTVDLPSHPIPFAEWVKVIAHIRNNKTGEVRLIETDEILRHEKDLPCSTVWSEGSFNCNCNRHLFFKRGATPVVLYDHPSVGFPSRRLPLSETEWGDMVCGEGMYSVNLENPATNEVYYREYS